MSAHETQAEPTQDPGQPGAAPQFYRYVLHGLINTGAAFTHLLLEQATAQAQAGQAQTSQAQAAQPQPAQQRPEPHPAPAPSLPDLAAAFDSTARTVRRCIMLAQNLDAPRKPARPPAPNHSAAPDRTAARKRILRAVEDTLGRQDYDDSYRVCDPTEALHAELLDRMDAPDLDRDIESRPIDDIIKDILRDLGLAALPGTRPWKRRTPADIAELCARAAAPSRPAGSTPREPGPGPQPPSPGAAQHSPDPQPDQREPGERADPAATPCAQPAPIHPGPVHPRIGLPKDPAEAVAFVLRYAADPRWRPPEG
jgi:hypothetical protein